MSEIYNNWERLVGATLRRENLRICALRTPSDLSTASPYRLRARLSDSLMSCTISFAEDDKEILVRTTAPNILVGLAKLVLPRKLLRDKITPKVDKMRSKAMKVTVSVPDVGMQKAVVEGKDKNQLVVKGAEGSDAVTLIVKLPAELWSVRCASNNKLQVIM